MNNVRIRFQHPFKTETEEISYINSEQTIKTFLAINWEQLNTDIYEKHDDVIHDYYFFEISYVDHSTLEHSLNLSGLYTHGEKLRLNGPQFYITYVRPVEKTSRGFLGLGKMKTKMVSAALEMEDCSINLVLACLKAFLNNDTGFLENNIENNATSGF